MLLPCGATKYPMNSGVRCFTFGFALAIVCLAQPPLVTRAQTTDSKPKGTASISGHVSIGDKPATGVTVVVVPSNSANSLLGQTVSDGDGAYRISALMPG